MKKDLLAPLPKKKIADLLAARDFENLKVINTIEQFFLKKRGYIFKMPPPKTPVILLLSGGIDSIILWAVLMKKYKLVVYPLFLRRKKTWFFNASVASIQHYSKLYRQNSPGYFQLPQLLNHFTAQQQAVRKIFALQKKHPRYLLKHVLKDEFVSVESAGLMAECAFAAYDYAQLLLAQTGKEIKSFFTAVTPSDGTFVKSQTLTSLRTALLDVCVNAQDYSLQFTSLPMEKELGLFHDKTVFMRWATENDIPLGRTHSCAHSLFIHCGRCIGCYSRQDAFRKIGLKDRTFYANHLGGRLRGALIYRLTKLKNSSSIKDKS